MDEQYWNSCVVFAERLAARFYRMLPVEQVEYDELKSAALLGLVEAKQRYQEGSGASFKTFAYLRIRGAMCDYLRKEHKFCSKHAPEAPEVPVPSDIPDPEFTILGRLSSGDQQFNDIEERVALRIAARRIESALKTVEDTHRQVVLKHYFEDKSFSQIGDELGGLAKATVCRYHKKAITALRDEFREVA